MDLPLRASWRRTVLRFRRPLAAVLSGLAVVLAVSSLTSAPVPAVPTPTRATTSPGEVTVPVPLAVRAVADALAPGAIVDLVSVTGDGRASIVAARARVVGQPVGGSGFAPTDALLLVAVPESQALAVATATAQGAMTVLIHGTPPIATEQPAG